MTSSCPKKIVKDVVEKAPFFFSQKRKSGQIHSNFILRHELKRNTNRPTDIERRSQNSYTTRCNGVVSQTTHMEANANKMCPQSSHALQHLTRVYLHAQTAVHKHLSNHGYLRSRGKPEYSQFKPHTSIKMALVLGSPVYLCEQTSPFIIFPPDSNTAVFFLTWNCLPGTTPIMIYLASITWVDTDVLVDLEVMYSCNFLAVSDSWTCPNIETCWCHTGIIEYFEIGFPNDPIEFILKGVQY